MLPPYQKVFFIMQNLSILQNQSVLKMTTREIAELTQKEHKHVLRDCQTMFLQLDIQAKWYVQNWTHPQNGLEYIEYLLDKDLALCLVAGYSAPLRLKIIKRLEELEKKQFTIPQTYAESLRLAADQSETIKEQAAQIEQQKPAVEFVEKYVNSTGLFGFRQVCKLLQVKENDFRAFLQDKAIMYRLNGEWVPYGRHIDAGRFYVSTGTSDTNHAFNSAKFTTKGVEWVITLYNNFLFNQIRSKQGSKA